MMHDRFEQLVNDQQVCEDGGVENDGLSDTAIEKVSVVRYESRSKSRSDFRLVNCWIAIGLYLVLVGIAAVVV